ncbi:MAG: hypothetical protein WCN95_14440 [bacterium]
MKAGIRKMLVFAVVAIAAGCEWEAPGDAGSWTDTGFSWINLTGAYRSTTVGGMMVLDPAYSSGTGSGGSGTGSTSGTVRTVQSEIIIYGNGTSTILEGILDNPNIVPLTMSVAGSGYVFVDNGDGTMTGTAGTTGTIEYETGRWALDFKGVAPDNGTQFLARYQWLQNNSSSVTPPDSTGTASNSITQGNSGKPIYKMFVEQQGNRLSITDGNGDRYDGIIVSVRSTSGSGQLGATGILIIQYQVTGMGKKANTTIEGSFMAEYSQQQEMSIQERIIRQRLGQQLNSGSGTTALLINRTLTGSWFEHDPAGNVIKAGDVIGVADLPTGGQVPPVDNNSLSNIVITI